MTRGETGLSAQVDHECWHEAYSDTNGSGDMTSARGANKTQVVGNRQGSTWKDRHSRKKELAGFQRQLAERLDLLARFRAKISPPDIPNGWRLVCPDCHQTGGGHTANCESTAIPQLSPHNEVSLPPSQGGGNN